MKGTLTSMRIETNKKLVKRNTQIAQYLFFFSLGILALAFFVTNQQLLGISPTSDEAAMLSVLIPSLVLPFGLISTLFSVRMTNLWIRRPRPELAIEEGLKGLSNKSVLYNYYHFPARHALICPQGIFAIVTRFQDGRFSVVGDNWRTHRSAFSRLTSIFRMDGIGNPTEDAMRAAAHLKKLLNPIAPEAEVQPLVVFVDGRAQLEVKEPVVPVVHANDKYKPNLKDFMRSVKPETVEPQPVKKGQKQPPKKKEGTMPLTPEQIEAFEAATLRR
jgi:hypothetical protein